VKPLAELDHYEVLEIPRDASSEEVERAYRQAQSTFAMDSLAIYSLFEDNDAARLRERIEQAYRILAHAPSRAHYDAALGDAPDGPTAADEIALDLRSESRTPPPPAEVVPEIASFDDLEDSDAGAFDGPRLRRARLRRGIDLDQIAVVTKIKASYLRFLEEERFEALPAPVYVRGFVAAYARCLGLDAQRVVPGYMERLAAALAPQPRVRRGRR
jgi:flagellar biosynthesis protein FlhG